MSMGRPTKYSNVDLNQIERLYSKSMTDEDVAEILDISTSTLYLWKNEHKDFSEAIKKGKDIADQRVEKSLYERATGYTHSEEKIFQYEGVVVRAETLKHYPPDTAAAFIWLKNRKPDKWRDKKEVSGKVDNKLLIEIIHKNGNGSVSDHRRSSICVN